MAVVKQRRRSSRTLTPSSSSGDRPERAPLLVFALLVILAPLAFGAVDRLVQLGVLALFAIGLWLCPPETVRLSRRGHRLLLAALAVLVLKEFAPAALFGGTEWRTLLTSGYELQLPWTHHPEPGRAVDALLALVVAACWFLWVRTLAGTRGNRTAVAWTLFSAAAIVALVSLSTRGMDAKAIYGLRYTPGWKGFGPFPNRNHTASLLAMGALVGAGCITWAAARRRFGLMTLGLALAALTMAGLIASQSRGGLVALGAGALVYMLFVLAKFRTRRVFGIVSAMALLVVGLGLAFGAPLLARFHGPSSEGSNQTRRAIWHDTATMWHDAPLFGHGLDTFTSLFPVYQRVQSDNEIVLHPESSWLQWLAELGLVPVAAGAVALLSFASRHARSAFERHSGFFLQASGFAAAAGLLTHCAIDVPAHRWGTAGFGLAALALATPRARRRPGSEEEWNVHTPGSALPDRRIALVPLAIAAFWALPLLTDWPVSSPLTLARVIDRATATTTVPVSRLEQQLAWFPLNPTLHQLLGLQELEETAGRHPDWRGHFRLASRLSPGSWALPMYQAQACTAVAPGYALSFWQDAVDRSGPRAPELLDTGVAATRRVPGAAGAWSSYVKIHPSLALAYAATLPAGAQRPWFDLWWRERGAVPTARLSNAEYDAFYAQAAPWLSAEQLSQWMARTADRAATDYPRWAALLHARHDNDTAWALLAKWRPEPAWPPSLNVPREQLEKRWQHSPENLFNAQALIKAWHEQGDSAAERRVLLATAQRPEAPEWFLRKAAWSEAGEGRIPEAVALMLREPLPAAKP